MTRRQKGRLQGERYVGNTRHEQVHDLDRETRQCHIDEIIESQHERPFESLEGAHHAGFEDCSECIGDSTRKVDLGGVSSRPQSSGQ